jgi:hypothetical protein
MTSGDLTALSLDADNPVPAPGSALCAIRQASDERPFRGVDPAGERYRNPCMFAAESGQRLRVDFSLEPVVNLERPGTAAMRIRPTVSCETTGVVFPLRAIAKLMDEDVARIDKATLDYGAVFLAKAQSGDPALIMPASFRTIAGRRSRDILVSGPRVAADQMKRGALVELTEIDSGTPAGRLLEVASFVRPLFGGVMVRLRPGRDALDSIYGARVHGLILDLSELHPDATQLRGLLRTTAQRMRGAAPNLMALGLAEPGHLHLAWEAGFTHASVRTAAESAMRAPPAKSPSD